MWETQLRQNSVDMLVYVRDKREFGCGRTDGVDDLVDHLLTELELMLAFTNVLSDGSPTVHLRVSEGWSTIGLTTRTLRLVIIVVVELFHGGLANAAVALSSSLVVLPSEVERLQEQQDGNLNDSKKYQHDLHTSLPWVELLFDSTGS